MPGRCLSAGQAEDRQIVRLGPTRGENHLGRVSPQNPRDRLLGELPGAPCRRPKECRLSALPAAKKNGRIASRTSGSNGVVAL